MALSLPFDPSRRRSRTLSLPGDPSSPASARPSDNMWHFSGGSSIASPVVLPGDPSRSGLTRLRLPLDPTQSPPSASELPSVAAAMGLTPPNPAGGVDVASYAGSRYANNTARSGLALPGDPAGNRLGSGPIDVNSYTGSMWDGVPSAMGPVMDGPNRRTKLAARKLQAGAALGPKDWRALSQRMDLEGQGLPMQGSIAPSLTGTRLSLPGDPAAMYAAQRQELTAYQSLFPDRNYSPAALGQATPAQVAGELAAIPNILKHRPQPKEPAGGYATAAEAQAAIPPGSRGQVQQNAQGRWVVQFQTGEEPAKPDKGTTLKQLFDERDAAAAAGQIERVDGYNKAIEVKSKGSLSPEEMATLFARALNPGVTTADEITPARGRATGSTTVDKSLAGRRLRGPDGKIYVVDADGVLNAEN